jgi:hypothetical protein
MGKRIVLLPLEAQPKPAQRPVHESWEPGTERRSNARRSGLPRRAEADRRSGGRYDSPHVERRDGSRRSLSERRRRRDRRFGLDPTLYDRLVDLDL